MCRRTVTTSWLYFLIAMISFMPRIQTLEIAQNGIQRADILSQIEPLRRVSTFLVFALTKKRSTFF
ncbi:MAG: hypothetical protein DCF15_10655 [Phormidesmis priestleyi]|uniref:Uncharacterized protein n=1 Tax=Phormidesmis priestleyi TaxID=268141 RepID=A0A2W4XDK4_9CYAN|nr:MAG: hypothetical protein DCF15_10655 [Phormidesmis priestleyi]